jgi:acetyl-CoA acetyltransferase
MSAVPAYVVGVGMTPFDGHPQLSVKALARAAVESALADAGLAASAAENGGGLHGIEEAVACVTILPRQDR